MTRTQLWALIQKKKSYLCIGLDTDINRLPDSLPKKIESVLSFNKRIVDATRDYCVAYKPNTAFYESLGSEGWDCLKQTVDYIGSSHFVIADAKRGDIGNTSELYARAFFDWLGVDCITVAPYMGADSVRPFFKPDKWVALLAHTSNVGSQDFQLLTTKEGRKFYEEVIMRSKSWASDDQLMYVVGATHADDFYSIRKLIPDHFLLVPGVGAQGGNLHDVSKAGLNAQGGLLVNASRSIIYASSTDDFDLMAAKEAIKMQTEMSQLLDKFC